MYYPELTLTDVTPVHIAGYLDSLHRMATSIAELSGEWAEMDEAEQLHFRLDLSRSFGLRRLLGSAYQAQQLSLDQVEALADIDRLLLAQAAGVEIIYGATLRQLVQDLFNWGTPLIEQNSILQIETTTTALAELVTV